MNGTKSERERERESDGHGKRNVESAYAHKLYMYIGDWPIH